MKTRDDTGDGLPLRIYMRRGMRVWTWFYKDRSGRTHVISRARADDGEQQLVAAAQAVRFADSDERLAIDGDTSRLDRRLRARLQAAQRAAVDMPGWAWRLLRQSKCSCARDRPHLVWTLSPNEFASVVQRAGGRCEVSGIAFEISDRLASARGPFGPSIDRIDSKLGYSAGNVRIVCVIVNVAMGSWGEAALLRVARAVADKADTARVFQSWNENDLAAPASRCQTPLSH